MNQTTTTTSKDTNSDFHFRAKNLLFVMVHDIVQLTMLLATGREIESTIYHIQRRPRPKIQIQRNRNAILSRAH